MEFDISDYEQAAGIQMECTYSGNYKRGNRASDKLLAFNKAMAADFERYRWMVDAIMENGSVNARLWVAGVVKELNYRREEMLEKLLAIAKDPTLGIISFNAKMMLEQMLENEPAGKEEAK